jgi:hypothetical protein
MNIIKSMSNSQEEIIKNILELHSPNKSIDLDPCYSKGQFYKNGLVPQPTLKFDLEPQTQDTIKASSDSLPLDDNTLCCIMFDPPFIITGKTYKTNKEGSSKITKRFGGYDNFDQLKLHYYNSLKEFYRLLKKDGVVIFKYQNTVSSGKQHLTDYFIKK